ncbi:circadian clock protein KaiC [Microtetraspora sp. NBRC 13810]|uniref:circadian clock protein KaiC n=1 Tax=Microtetraspora sp. NBRC 13810 TaxID=3030990 RepID=UPI0024A13093|nr:circadian clock protein KaiC [Microtetraspora sp. NBRC 13810]GLW07776.1 circadian clock protein KaiC [Microtetraspora sp. NBRC 13810]
MAGNTIERVPTGINGFDHIALGGLPARRSTLVSGTTGSGKTLFAVEFLARGITHHDEAGVFVTFEETAADIRRNSASLGFPLEEWERDRRWAFVDVSADIGEDAPVIGAFDFGGLLARIRHAVQQTGARRVAVDSLGAIFTRFADFSTVRHELHQIASALKELGVTAVLTAERPEEYNGVTRYGVEQFVLDNVIILRNVLQHGRRSRTVEIVKFRGASHRTGEWLFTIDPRDGIVVVPLAFLAPSGRTSLERVTSGNRELDEMCGGGFYRDALVILSGPSGTGKTLASLCFAAAAFGEGKKCLFRTFDETEGQLFRNAAGLGLDLQAMRESGLLHVVSGYPEEASPEEHFLQLRRTIEEFAPSRLVIDSLSALERAVAPRALFDFVIALVALLRQNEITTLLTATPSGRLMPAGMSTLDMEIAGLADVSILLQYVERVGEIHRAIVVLQSRGSSHDQSIREITIDETGMHIGEPLRDISQVLTGNMRTDDRWAPPRPGETEGR